MSIVRVREPGRHLSRNDRLFDRLRPRPCFSVAQQRHRPDLARPMAALAIFLQDRKNVLVEGDRPAGLLAGPRCHRPPTGAHTQYAYRASSNANLGNHVSFTSSVCTTHSVWGSKLSRNNAARQSFIALGGGWQE